MMTHRDDRLPASIDGIPFYFRSWSTEPGRRTHVHEFYGADKPFVEDLGKAAYRLTADIFLIGPDYHRQRDRLRSVLESPGPYRLRDPYRGDIMVRLASVPKLDETIQKDGMVQIGSLSLVEAGSERPTIGVVTKGKISDLAGIALQSLAANTTFSLRAAIPGVLSTSQPSAIDGIRDSILRGFNTAASFMRRMSGRVDGALGQISNTAAAIDRFDEQIETLMNTPRAAMSALHNIMWDIMGVVKNFQPIRFSVDVEEPEWPLAQTALGVIYATGTFLTAPVDAPYVPEGPQRAIEEAAHHEITLQMRAAGAIAGAEVAGSLTYDGSTQALAMKEQIQASFAAVLEDPTLHPQTFEAMAALRSTTVVLLLDQAAKLPQVETVTLREVTPGLVLAWHFYQDPGRANEIARRNDIDCSGFLPAREELEVLSA